MKRIAALNKQNAQGKVKAQPQKGYIEMQDMIKLEKLKRLIFWDYDRADKII